MKVTTDACLFGAWIVSQLKNFALTGGKILDVGAGTGVLSLMIAQQWDSNIEAIEIDKNSFEQASDNIAASAWKKQIHLYQGDIRSFEFQTPFDIIVSNPPFYENELLSANSRKNLAHHSAELSLTELVAAIKKNLNSQGQFFLLLPYKRNAEIKQLLLGQELSIHEMVLVRPSIGQSYFRIMVRGGLKAEPEAVTAIDDMSICNEKKEYTPEFISLLADYYLYL